MKDRVVFLHTGEVMEDEAAHPGVEESDAQAGVESVPSRQEVVAQGVGRELHDVQSELRRVSQSLRDDFGRTLLLLLLLFRLTFSRV